MNYYDVLCEHALIELLFNDKINGPDVCSLQVNDLVWRRALLASAYTYAKDHNKDIKNLYYPIQMDSSDKYSLIVNSPNDNYGWKSLFNNAAYDHYREKKHKNLLEQKYKNFYDMAESFFKQLKIEFSKQLETNNKADVIDTILNDVIEKVIKDGSIEKDDNDWRYWFIHESESSLKDNFYFYGGTDSTMITSLSSIQWVIITKNNDSANLVSVLKINNTRSVRYNWNIILLSLKIHQMLFAKNIKNIRLKLYAQGVEKNKCRVSFKICEVEYEIEYDDNKNKYIIDILSNDDVDMNLSSEGYDLNGVIEFLEKRLVLN